MASSPQMGAPRTWLRKPQRRFLTSLSAHGFPVCRVCLGSLMGSVSGDNLILQEAKENSPLSFFGATVPPQVLKQRCYRLCTHLRQDLDSVLRASVSSVS